MCPARNGRDQKDPRGLETGDKEFQRPRRQVAEVCCTLWLEILGSFLRTNSLKTLAIIKSFYFKLRNLAFELRQPVKMAQWAERLAARSDDPS